MRVNESLYIDFSAMALPVRKQPIGAYMRRQDCALYQKISDALLVLRIHGIITRPETERAYKRVVALIKRRKP